MPEGKPSEVNWALLYSNWAWTPPGDPVTVTMPVDDLRRLALHMHQWRSYAMALELAGIWAK